MPTPGKIPGFNLIDTGAELQDAVGAAPGVAAQRQATVADANAETQLAPLKVQQAKADATKDSLASDDAMLARLAPILSGPMGAQALQNPQLRAVLDPILQRRGLSADDPEAIKSIVSPTKQFTQYTPAEINQLRALPPEVRQRLVPDAPDTFKNAPVQVPLTGPGETAIYKNVDQNRALLAAGKLTPGEFYTSVQEARQRLLQAGAGTGAVDVNLNPEGTGLSDEIKQQTASAYADAQIAKIQALTGLQVDAEQLKHKLYDEKIREFDRTAGQRDVTNVLKGRALDQADTRIKIAAQRERDYASIAATQAGNLQARWATLSNTQDYQNFTKGMAITKFQQGVLTERFKAVSGEYDKALSQLEQNKRAIANGASGDDIVNATTDLQNTVNTLKPEVDAMKGKLFQQPAATYQNQTGHGARVISTDGQTQNSKGTVSRADVLRIGASRGMSADAAIKDAQAHGYTVGP